NCLAPGVIDGGLTDVVTDQGEREQLIAMHPMARVGPTAEGEAAAGGLASGSRVASQRWWWPVTDPPHPPDRRLRSTGASWRDHPPVGRPARTSRPGSRRGGPPPHGPAARAGAARRAALP